MTHYHGYRLVASSLQQSMNETQIAATLAALLFAVAPALAATPEEFAQRL
jgi:hypothetical protein